MDLIEALRSLDDGNDGHWTQQGLPRLDVLSQLTGTELQRRDVTAAVPSFSRADRTLPEAAQEPEPEIPEGVAEAVAATKGGLQASLDRVQGQIADAQATIASNQRVLITLEEEEAKLATMLEERYPQPSPGQAMKDHIRRQHEIRLAVANARIASGQPVPASPLDAALASRPRPFQNPAGAYPLPKPQSAT